MLCGPSPEAAALAYEEALRSLFAGRDLPRITLTPVIINQARVVAFLVAGVRKAAILKETLLGPGEPRRLAAQFIKPLTGEIYWLVDQSAADF